MKCETTEQVRKKGKTYLKLAGVFFLLITLLAIIGLTYHTEPGFLHACWPRSEGYLTYNGACPQEIKWSRKQIPLAVRLAMDSSSDVYRKSIQEAMATWNREVGLVFIEIQAGHADVIVQWGPSQDGMSGGYTRHIGSAGQLRYAVVTLTDPSDLHAVYRYAMHELGHVLGLAHDSATRSIMYPIQPSMTGALIPALPSDSDIKLLKRAYK